MIAKSLRVPRVPLVLRAVLALALMGVAFVLNVACILVEEAAAWIVPEFARTDSPELRQ